MASFYGGDGDEADWAAEEVAAGDVAAHMWRCGTCMYSNNPIMPHCEMCSQQPRAAPPDFEDIGVTGVRGLFLSQGDTLSAHCEAMNADPDAYVGELRQLLSHNVVLLSANLVRAVATLGAFRQHALFNELLPTLSVAEMLAVVKALDTPRKVRQLQRRQQVLSSQGASRVKRDAVRAEIATLSADMLDRGNLTGAIARKVRKQLARIPTERLQFFLLNFPRQPWQELADLVHIRPQDMKLDKFMSFMFGETVDEDTVYAQVQACSTADELAPILEAHPVLYTCYSFLRVKFGTTASLPDNIKVMLCENAPLEDVLWFYEELRSSAETDAIVEQRLQRQEPIVTVGRSRGNYGKLCQRLLTFRTHNIPFAPLLVPYCETRLHEIEATTPRSGASVVVLGDASGSMEVAIHVSTIIGSSLAVCLHAELGFFNDGPVKAALQPTCASDVLSVTESVRATGLTSPAAGLAPYLASRKHVDMFVLVSDEDENTPYNGRTFAETFEQYRREVNDKAKVFLVSFLSAPLPFIGKMRASLRLQGIGCRQFRFEISRPDLSRLPQLLSLLSLEASDGAVLAVPETDAPPMAAAVAVPLEGSSMGAGTVVAAATAVAADPVGSGAPPPAAAATAASTSGAGEAAAARDGDGEGDGSGRRTVRRSRPKGESKDSR